MRCNNTNHDVHFLRFIRDGKNCPICEYGELQELSEQKEEIILELDGLIIDKARQITKLKSLLKMAGTCGVCASRSYMRCPVVDESKKPEYSSLLDRRDGAAK